MSQAGGAPSSPGEAAQSRYDSEKPKLKQKQIERELRELQRFPVPQAFGEQYRAKKQKQTHDSKMKAYYENYQEKLSATQPQVEPEQESNDDEDYCLQLQIKEIEMMERMTLHYSQLVSPPVQPNIERNRLWQSSPDVVNSDFTLNAPFFPVEANNFSVENIEDDSEDESEDNVDNLNEQNQEIKVQYDSPLNQGEYDPFEEDFIKMQIAELTGAEIEDHPDPAPAHEPVSPFQQQLNTIERDVNPLNPFLQVNTDSFLQTNENPFRLKDDNAGVNLFYQPNEFAPIMYGSIPAINNNPQNELPYGRQQDPIENFYCENIIKIDENKFRCNICGKLFKDRQFVIKHFHLKHLDLLNEINQANNVNDQIPVQEEVVFYHETSEQRERRELREEQDAEFYKSLLADKQKEVDSLLDQLETFEKNKQEETKEKEKEQIKLTKEQTIEKLKVMIENIEENERGEKLIFIFKFWFGGKPLKLAISSTLSWSDVLCYFQQQALENGNLEDVTGVKFLVNQSHPAKLIEYSLEDTLDNYKGYARQVLHVSIE